MKTGIAGWLLGMWMEQMRLPHLIVALFLVARARTLQILLSISLFDVSCYYQRIEDC